MRRVAVLWLNYNSANFIDIVLKSLKSLLELDYDNYFIYVIDNGSTDGSFEKILKFLDSYNSNRCFKIVRLSRNLGFDGAMNIVWKVFIINRDYDYILLVNNDAIAYPESLTELVEHFETVPNLCGAQGIIELKDLGVIDSFGVYIDELLNTIPFLRLRRVCEVPKHGLYVTYIKGAYALYKVNILKKICLKYGDLFPRQAFGYWDDDLLGLRAWSMNFKMAAFPVLTCKHYESLTFKRELRISDYFSGRNYVAKILTYKTPLKPILLLTAFKYCLRRFLRGLRYGGKVRPSLAIRSLYDGIVLYRRVKKMYDLTIDLRNNNIPIVRYGFSKALKYSIMYKLVYEEREKIEKEIMEKYRID
ncbi:MAG: glycosyltransferase family 2 protein [Crenarchaeota archaeon]|nr:glycosyltransferase family 2 protein [Thermoproteota archaeon]